MSKESFAPGKSTNHFSDWLSPSEELGLVILLSEHSILVTFTSLLPSPLLPSSFLYHYFNLLVFLITLKQTQTFPVVAFCMQHISHRINAWRRLNNKNITDQSQIFRLLQKGWTDSLQLNKGVSHIVIVISLRQISHWYEHILLAGKHPACASAALSQTPLTKSNLQKFHINLLFLKRKAQIFKVLQWDVRGISTPCWWAEDFVHGLQFSNESSVYCTAI